MVFGERTRRESHVRHTDTSPAWSAHTRRRLLAAMGVVGGAVPLEACAGAVAGNTQPAAPKGAARLSLLTDWTSGPRLKVMEDSMAQWKQRYPNVAVEVRPTDRVQDKLVADFAAGTQPDVALFSADGVAALRDQFVDLAPFIKRDKVDMREFVGNDPALQPDGRQYGMPFNFNLSAWVYNKTLFQKAGATLPTPRWTWADLAQAAARLTNRDQRLWGMEITNNPGGVLFPALLWSNGGDYLSPDRTRTLLGSAEASDAARWIADQINRTRTSISFDERREVTATGVRSAFWTGSVGVLYLNLNMGVIAPADARFEWDVMAAPLAPRTGKAAYNTLPIQPHCITKRSGRPASDVDAAWALTAFLSGSDVMQLIAEGRGGIPVHRKVLNGERYLRRPPESMALVPKMVEGARILSWFRGYDQWKTAVDKALDLVWQGKVGVDDGLRTAVADGDAALAAARR